MHIFINIHHSKHWPQTRSGWWMILIKSSPKTKATPISRRESRFHILRQKPMLFRSFFISFCSDMKMVCILWFYWWISDSILIHEFCFTFAFSSVVINFQLKLWIYKRLLFFSSLVFDNKSKHCYSAPAQAGSHCSCYWIRRK